MGMIRWLNRHRWGFALLWAVPALLLAAVSRTWRVGAVLLIWIPLAIAVAWLYFTALEKEMKQARDALETATRSRCCGPAGSWRRDFPWSGPAPEAWGSPWD